MANFNIDDNFATTEGIEVYSRAKFFRYRKRFKGGLTGNGRKQSQFHQKDKDRSSGVRRD